MQTRAPCHCEPLSVPFLDVMLIDTAPHGLRVPKYSLSSRKADEGRVYQISIKNVITKDLSIASLKGPNCLAHLRHQHTLCPLTETRCGSSDRFGE